MPATEAVVLPTNVIPSKYLLKLQPNLGNFTFQGEEAIDVEVKEATSQIVLNSSEIEIQSASLTKGGNANAASQITYDQERETATLDFGQQLSTGPAQLTIKFTGELNDKLRGFYRSPAAGRVSLSRACRREHSDVSRPSASR